MPAVGSEGPARLTQSTLRARMSPGRHSPPRARSPISASELYYASSSTTPHSRAASPLALGMDAEALAGSVAVASHRRRNGMVKSASASACELRLPRSGSPKNPTIGERMSQALQLMSLAEGPALAWGKAGNTRESPSSGADGEGAASAGPSRPPSKARTSPKAPTELLLSRVALLKPLPSVAGVRSGEESTCSTPTSLSSRSSTSQRSSQQEGGKGCPPQTAIAEWLQQSGAGHGVRRQSGESTIHSSSKPSTPGAGFDRGGHGVLRQSGESAIRSSSKPSTPGDGSDRGGGVEAQSRFLSKARSEGGCLQSRNTSSPGMGHSSSCPWLDLELAGTDRAKKKRSTLIGLVQEEAAPRFTSKKRSSMVVRAQWTNHVGLSWK